MKISHLKTNHLTNPLGFSIDQPTFSWSVEDTRDRTQTAARVIVAADPQLYQVIYDSGKVPGQRIDSLAYRPPLSLSPRTRYYWQVKVWGESEQATSEIAWFETGKMDEPWQAEWITPDFADNEIHPVMVKGFELPADVLSARAYVCGLGLYRLELNGQKVGDDQLTPHFNVYDKWLQYQTYDISGQLSRGKNRVEILLGNGWYKGRFGFSEMSSGKNLYGDRFALICEIHIRLVNGEELVIPSDLSWQASPSPILESSIYDGEMHDARVKRILSPVKTIEIDNNMLQARRSLPVCINEEIKPVEVIHTPAGETVLDLGQNMVGWLRFRTHAPTGTRIHLLFGEVLQGGNFYNANLRSARAEYTYISDGQETLVEPYFTFYGFRYVKLEGWEGDPDLDDFTGCVVYSQMDITGEIETSNPKVNQLFSNAMWGQKGNFLDIPTDCPQRDERMGWTGDTQVFSGTACFNMDTHAFYAKFGYDTGLEQSKNGGMVPNIIPAAKQPGGGSSAWADVATILPWIVYEFSGDKAILEQQFESMRGWVNYIKGVDEATGGKRLWTSGFHFGDWLALDGDDPNSPKGGTPDDYISSAYYYHSTRLVARAAEVLGKKADAGCYNQLAEEIKAAIQAEYFTLTGRIAIGTQTGMVLGLYMDLVPEEHRQRLVSDLVTRLRKDKMHLRTGFVGTPYLCRVLSRHGANELAYRLLLNEDYPSWLYAVNLGATTIWERWNSLNPDGTISSTGMNSLNHYAYGSIVEWMYRDMCGLNPSTGDDLHTGFRRAHIAPKPNRLLKWAKASYRSAAGLYESGWQIVDKGRLEFNLLIPFNATALVTLPDAALGEITLNGEPVSEGKQVDKNVELELKSGVYHITYQPTTPYYEVFSTYSPIVTLLKNPKVFDLLKNLFPPEIQVNEQMLSYIGDASLRELAQTPYTSFTNEQLDELDQLLKNVSAD